MDGTNSIIQKLTREKQGEVVSLWQKSMDEAATIIKSELLIQFLGSRCLWGLSLIYAFTGFLLFKVDYHYSIDCMYKDILYVD